MPPHNIPEKLKSPEAIFGTDGRMFNTGSGVSENFMFAWGTAVPTDGDTGYGKGCLFSHTDGADAQDLLYVNNGTNTSSAFVT